jgi:hypothetical protein
VDKERHLRISHLHEISSAGQIDSQVFGILRDKVVTQKRKRGN